MSRPLRLLRLTLTFAGAIGCAATANAGTSGADVTVFNFPDVTSYGPQDNFMGYSIGTRSCNRGDVPLNWCDEANCAPGAEDTDHPVIIQNLYRITSGRFEQIGMAWLKHGFFAENHFDAACTGPQGQTCGGPGPYGGDQLMVGCTDPYVASLYNSARPLGLRSEVNATKGEFLFPYGTQPGPYTSYSQRVKVPVADVDPAQNAGAVYLAEGHYVAPDDAAAGNGLNNASCRQVTFSGSPGYTMAMTGSFFEKTPAIVRWSEVDGAVELVAVDVPGSSPVERFHVARKVTETAPGEWHHEYAIHNLNSDRSARRFTVDFPDGTVISNAGFSAPDYHSGEVYSSADWTSAIDAPSSSVSWSTATYATDVNANALRYATAYTFWFDADAPASSADHVIELFKPGSPTEVSFNFYLFADDFEGGNMDEWSLHVP